MTHTVNYAELDTSQKVFDHVVAHLFTQGKKAEDAEGDCMYRTADPEAPDVTLMCAAGACISDEDYTPNLENNSIAGLLSAVIVPQPNLLKFLKKHAKLLEELQDTHDQHPIRGWFHRFQGVATDFDLKFTHSNPNLT